LDVLGKVLRAERREQHQHPKRDDGGHTFNHHGDLHNGAGFLPVLRGQFFAQVADNEFSHAKGKKSADIADKGGNNTDQTKGCHTQQTRREDTLHQREQETYRCGTEKITGCSVTHG